MLSGIFDDHNYTKLVLICASPRRPEIMKNVTITLDETTAAWVRVHAAEHNMSVSRMVGEMLHEHMRERHDYDAAMRRFLSKKPARLKKRSAKYPTREQLHDRTGLR
jgi:hypothetical protein